MEEGYERAWSDNLPEILPEMLARFFSSNPDFVGAEMSGTKTTRATQAVYGEEASGFVQLKRQGETCIIKARVTPEHKLRNPDYRVTIVINETQRTILSAECTGCVACKGGCKHSVAFIFWLYRRSCEPAVTSKECYWKSSRLSRIARGKSFVKAAELGKKTPPTLPNVPDFKSQVVSVLTEKNSQAMICNIPLRDNVLLNSSMYYLGLTFEDVLDADGSSGSPEFFLNFCRANMTTEMCKAIEISTRNQADSSLWFEMRFGRITASRAYNCSVSHTYDGSLVEIIMGAGLPLKLAALSRGKDLEPKVLAVVAAQMDVKIEKCGFFMVPEIPIFGASPDGVTDELCFEVKCPSKESTVTHYIKDGEVTKAPYAQMQLQMHLSKRKKCIFCVASPNFETNNLVTLKEVHYDAEYCSELIKKCQDFWNVAIFNKICKQ